jgi:hypothetical protein
VFRNLSTFSILGVVFLCPLVYGQQPLLGETNATAEDGHQHPTHGPHDGELLEIGNEEYHAEIVIDKDKNQFVVFLLDQQVKSYVALDVPHITVNLMIKGRPMQVKLKAAPQEIDAKGFASCFGAVSPELMNALHDPKAEPKLALKIRNKAYSVKIANDHDHEGHHHAGHDHGGHAHAPSTTKRK